MMLPATANWEEREGKRDGSDWGEDLNWEVVRQLRTGAWPKNQRSGRGADWRWREMGGSGTNGCTKTKAITHRSTLVADLDANLDHVDGLDDASGDHS